MENADVKHAVSSELSPDFCGLFEAGDGLVEPALFSEVGAEQEVAVAGLKGVLAEEVDHVLGVEHVVLFWVDSDHIAQVSNAGHQVKFGLELLLLLLPHVAQTC